MIWPFGTVWAVPSMSRNVVRRRLKSSTTPSTPAMRTTSPWLYWFSSTMKMPASQSRTTACAPKPTAIPTTPSPATAGPMSIPNSRSAINTAMIAITLPAIWTTSRPMVWTRRSSSAGERTPGPVSLFGCSSRWRMPTPIAMRRTKNATRAVTAIRASFRKTSADAGRFGRSSMARMVTSARGVPRTVQGQYFRVLRTSRILAVGCGLAAPPAMGRRPYRQGAPSR